jgi:hypothetical protein|tara:strand:+ start:598 stop:1434 length:837 start_codon:yes stop_codon:yes gene_type:complete
MTELEQFIKFNENKSPKTKGTYERMYRKLSIILESDVGALSEDKIIELVNNEINNINTIQSLLNIAVLIKKMKNMKFEKLQAERKNNVNKVEIYTKEENDKKKQIYPSLQELIDYTNYLYDNGKWTDYIINYLILNNYVRNKDLNFTITLKKKDTIDKEKNYIWLDNRFKKAVYIRRDYKTFDTYGEKQSIIKDDKFLIALRRIVSHQKHKENQGVFIPNENALGYYIQKATFQELGEGNYLKIIINHHLKNENPHILKEISKERGTDLQTLISNYTI